MVVLKKERNSLTLIGIFPPFEKKYFLLKFVHIFIGINYYN